MAPFQSQYTGQEIENAIAQVHNKAFTSVMKGVTPDGTADTQLVTVKFVNDAINTALGEVNTILDSINGVSI